MNTNEFINTILTAKPIVLTNAAGYGSCTFEGHPEIIIKWGDVLNEDYFDNRLKFESAGQGDGYIALNMKFFYKEELLATEVYLGVDNEIYYIPFDSSLKIPKARAEFYKLINSESNCIERYGLSLYINALKRTGLTLVDTPWNFKS